MNAYETENELELPPTGMNVMVQCEGFRCLAYRNYDGKWISTFSQEELKKIIRVFPWEDSGSQIIPVNIEGGKPRCSGVPIRYLEKSH